MELPPPAARYLGVGDRELLAGMRCSTGAWFEDDVETFIQTRLADYHDWRQPHTDHTIVGLELADLGLVAVGSHESDLIRDGGQVVTSTYLECAAVRTDLQGALLPEVEPLDDDGLFRIWRPSGGLPRIEHKTGGASRALLVAKTGEVAAVK